MSRYNNVKKTHRYTEEFKVKAIQLSQLPDPDHVAFLAEAMAPLRQVNVCSSQSAPCRLCAMLGPQEAWQNWLDQAMNSGIEALQRLAQRLKPYLHGILARCRHPLNTSVVEGINNAIKVIKRRAYGYRDQEYFFLKIRAAFPGNAR